MSLTRNSRGQFVRPQPHRETVDAAQLAAIQRGFGERPYEDREPVYKRFADRDPAMAAEFTRILSRPEPESAPTVNFGQSSTTPASPQPAKARKPEPKPDPAAQFVCDAPFYGIGIVIILLFMGFGGLLTFEGVAAAYPWAEHVRQSWHHDD